MKQLHQTPRLSVLVWWCCEWVAIWVKEKQRPNPPTLLQRRLLYALSWLGEGVRVSGAIEING